MKVALDGPARERAEESGRLLGQAQMHMASGNHAEAANLHMQRGKLHEEAEDHKAACDAYKAACDCYGKMTSK